MNKLEHYLQQVCRSMGGPKALREHVRQELREHLLDAISQHQTAGLSEQKAIDRALAEFGTPETVRSELEATHGHRMMLAMVIDKAMEWKEKTMKAKWLWATWTYLMVVGIIVLEILFCFFCMIYLLPKMKKLKHDGFIPVPDDARSIVNWMFDFIYGVASTIDQWFWWSVLGFAALWALFEWRVKSENKPFMRLSVLNSMALGLLLVVVIMSVSMILPFLLSTPALGRMTPASMVQQLESIDTSLIEAQLAAKKNDELAVAFQLSRVTYSLSALSNGPAFSAWLQFADQPTTDVLAKSIEKTKAQIEAANLTISNGDTKALVKSIESIQQAFEPVRAAVKRVRQKVIKEDR
ncbi:MAG: hypothetical protein JNJ77_03285 [Planctomycetia bacterium]|nr:hypothetical protein [Planctomycetia bacterium]